MNWWMLAGGAMALICAAGHAVAGWGMFYRPIKADLRSELHAAVPTNVENGIPLSCEILKPLLDRFGAGGRIAEDIRPQR